MKRFINRKGQGQFHGWQKIKDMDCQFNLLQIAKVPIERHVKIRSAACSEIKDVNNTRAFVVTFLYMLMWRCCLSGVINGNGYTITNLNFQSERGHKLTKANLNNVTFKNTSIHNENSFDHLFDIDDHWRYVKFINIETTGAPFNQLFYSLDNKELTDVSIDFVGVKLAVVRDLVSSRISRSSINNIELLNAFVSRHS